jgi:8-oxo-dGTP diphosphatase
MPEALFISMSRPPIPVVAAVIRRGDRVLIAQRPPGKALALKWEFPGGKVEPGESPEAAIVREIHEELGLPIRVLRVLPSFVHHYATLSIELIPILAEPEPGAPEPHPHEHVALEWIPVSELAARDLAEADLPVLGLL